MIGIVAGDNVDLAQNIVLVLTAVGQWRKEINVGVGDDGDQLLPVGA